MRLFCGKCEDVLKELADNSVETMVCDPPGGIAFMGKDWDKDHGGRDNWIEYMAGIFRECLRVLKPGAHALIWALPRTSHWTAMALEDAGFEIRDIVNHIFGSGFPKSLAIGKAIDKAAGTERKITGMKIYGDGKPCHYVSEKAMNESAGKSQSGRTTHNLNSIPTTSEAKQWEGWGTALKPACEHWILVQKPLSSVRLSEIHEITKGDYYHTTSTCYEKSKRFNKYLALGYEPIVENQDELIERLTPKVEQKIEDNGGLDFEIELQKAIEKAKPKKLFRFVTKLALHDGVESTWLIEHSKGTSVLKTDSFKNLNKKNVAVNALKHGTGGVNIDGCRVGVTRRVPASHSHSKSLIGPTGISGKRLESELNPNIGRFPANVVLDDSEVVRAGFPNTKSGARTGKSSANNNRIFKLHGHACKASEGSAARFFYCAKQDNDDDIEWVGDGTFVGLCPNHAEGGLWTVVDPDKPVCAECGGAVVEIKEQALPHPKQSIQPIDIEMPRRFIYTPKASKKDRDEGLDGFEEKTRYEHEERSGVNNSETYFDPRNGKTYEFKKPLSRNNHPTVKSTPLMRYLCRLITPKNGTVLDPFMGSGSTGKAAVLEGFDFIGIEQDAEYFRIAEARIGFVLQKQEKQGRLVLE